MTLAELIAYYKKLLIIQYSSDEQPKAQATIELFAETMLASGIFFDVKNAYNLNASGGDLFWDESTITWDTSGLGWDDGYVGIAVGKQLDVIGKYVGVDRYFSSINVDNYFSLVEYSEAIPASPTRWGFEDYAMFGEYNYNGTLTYDGIATTNNALSDADYLILIRLKIIQNTSNYSHEQIDTQMFNFFGTTIRPESAGNMVMAYFITATLTQQIQAILFKKLLPKPMGVGMVVVTGVQGLMFGLSDYDTGGSVFASGFSTYSNYDSLSGQVLIYDQIAQG